MAHVEFGFNDLDNLIFVHADNHTKGKQRGHSEYDAKIQKRIDSRLSEYMDDQNYVQALAELKKIIDEVKKQFIDEIIGSGKNANDV